MSGVSKVNKKSNLEKLLKELFENEKEILDQNPDPEIVNAGQPEVVSSISDDDMSAWLAATYGGNSESSNGLNEEVTEETFENIEENSGTQGVSVKI
jgi:hypothetical protein